MRKHKFEVSLCIEGDGRVWRGDLGTWGRGIINNKVVFSKEDESHTAYREVETELNKQLYQSMGGWQQINAATEGQKGSMNVTVSWECTMNGRAPARPKAVIAAEKAARAVKFKARRERDGRWEREAAERVVNLRNRIKHQVDHAFVTGKSGTEPASKYITCQHCDGPAALVCLSRLPARGASVLDEDTIVGSLCSNHSNCNGNQSKIPCAKLEFFYDGIRQIAIKP